MKKKRNYGIDLLRLVSMFFVVLLHSLLFGKALQGEGDFFEVAWFMEAAAFCAVDIFGIISGYVGFRDKKKEFKIKPIVTIWGLGLFYSVLILAAVAIFNSGIVTKAVAIENMTPVFHNTYWYLTAYIFLLLMMPMLNAWVRELSKKQCAKLVWIILILTALLSVKDLLSVGDGYSAIWLAILYLLGACMKKSDFLAGVKKRWLVLGIVACSVIVWGVKMLAIGGVIKGSIPIALSKIAAYSYLAPAVVFMAVLYVKLFSSFEFKNRTAIKVIEWTAPCAFSIFLLNSHPLIRTNYIPAWLSPIGGMHGVGAVLYVLLFAMGFFLVAVAIDKIRHYLVVLILKIFNTRSNKLKS